MTTPVTKHDPRSKTGPFEVLFDDIQKCKADRTKCPSLKIRQFYFEPNSKTASLWKKRGRFTEGIDDRLMFICESPGPSAKERNGEDWEPCFFGFEDSSSRDQRFMKVRRKMVLADCYITNTVKCGARRGKKHSKAEVSECTKFLVDEINLIKPKIIVAVGGNAHQIVSKEVMEQLETKPILHKITHYSYHGDPRDKWKKEFAKIKSDLRRLSKPVK